MILKDILKLTRGVARADVSDQMLIDFMKNPNLGEMVRATSSIFIEMVDMGYFSKETTPMDEDLIKIVKSNFPDRDPVKEVRIYKTEHMLYAMLKVMETAKFLELLKQKSTSTQIKEQAQEIWDNYKKSKSVL